MAEIFLENIYFELNKYQIAKNINLSAKGMCCLTLSPSTEIIKNLFLLFSKTHLYSSNEIKIEGNLYFNGKLMHASKVKHLLNQHVIIDGIDTVLEALTFIDKRTSKAIIKLLDIDFPEKRVDRLSINESKIFEIAVNMASKAKIIYLRNFNLGPVDTYKYLKLLRNHSILCDVVVIVDLDVSILLQESSLFDSIIASKNISLCRIPKNSFQRVFISTKNLSFEDSYDPETSDESNIDDAYKTNMDKELVRQGSYDKDLRCKYQSSFYDNLLVYSTDPQEDFTIDQKKFCIFEQIFDSAILVSGNSLVSLEKESALNFYRNLSFSNVNLQKNRKDLVSDLVTNRSLNPYNYKDLFRERKTENIVDLKQCKMGIFRRFTCRDFYRINIRQACNMAFRKYEMNYNNYERKIWYLKSIFPVLLCIFIIRTLEMLHQQYDRGMNPDLFFAVAYALTRVDKVRSFLLSLIILLTFKDFTMIGTYKLVSHILTGEISKFSHKFVIGSVFLSIFYSHSSFFDEEQQEMRFNMNITFTPGTCTLYYLLFITISHFSLFSFLGIFLRVRGLGVAVLASASVCLMFCSSSGKRLNAILVGFFLGTIILKNISKLFRIELKVARLFYTLVYPCAEYVDHFISSKTLTEAFFHRKFLFSLLYLIVAFIQCVFFLSFR